MLIWIRYVNILICKKIYDILCYELGIKLERISGWYYGKNVFYV